MIKFLKGHPSSPLKRINNNPKLWKRILIDTELEKEILKIRIGAENKANPA